MSHSRTVLAIDLSSTRGVIAVLREGTLLFEAVFTAERSHNAQVFAPLGQALEAMGSEPGLIIIGTGPGSYTGVRIAIAAAQGIALSRGWPVIGWPSITTAPEADCQVIGDARRGMFYTASVTNRLLGPIEIVDAATAQARVQTGGDWRSFDARPPLGLPQVQLCPPDAGRLAETAAGLSEDEIQALAARPLEPVYLQEAFITKARKAGKKVPGSRPA
ncbi:tRNA (adenosine(37)-N6)-threonylcarbamoyltransferase complex dimerization subunit type 1 TsaB [Prosthecobacter sp. SYSU 5D2]|uniref:tRNA (adenosine(37)-N6)-threonylcarbamoyltransferase complex dimerization subunit type 1 TsaB n=1 Tax=Prosthecobacter sp. SYSU 5D2 TaxID=3134134 RepID=UPI0031FEC561